MNEKINKHIKGGLDIGDSYNSTKAVDYKEIVTLQIMRVAHMLSYAKMGPSYMKNAASAVEVLASLVALQSREESYKDKLDQLKKDHNQLKKDTPKKKWAKKEIELRFEYINKKFELLMELLGKVGLSYVPEVCVDFKRPSKKKKSTDVLI